MRIGTLLVAAVLFLVPSLAGAAPVLRAGELSVGAELQTELFHIDFVRPSDRFVSPGTGFNVRYAFDERFALIGTLGLFVSDEADVDDGPQAYAVGAGVQFNLVQSRSTALMLRGGIQFIPRTDVDPEGADDQELGIRIWMGPGVETRVAEQLSLALYTPLADLQLGGNTRFNLGIVPTLAMFLYF